MQGFLNLFQNPLVLSIVGLAVKYVPALAKIPNALIPYLNAALALLAAMTGASAVHTSFAAFQVADFGGTFVGHLAGACWTAIQSALIYEVFGRHPLEKGLGWQKAS